MLPAEAFHIAFANLRTNIVRSVLSILGIVIGIASVITILSFGLGARERILKGLNGNGNNVLHVQPQFDPTILRGGEIHRDDLIRIQSLPFVELIVPQMDIFKPVRSRKFAGLGTIKGVSAGFIETREWPVVAGRSFSILEDNEQSDTCMISERTADTFFPNGDAVNSALYVDGVSWTVIGVYRGVDMGPDPVFGHFDAEVLTPFGALMRKTKNADIRSLDIHVSAHYRGNVAEELMDAMTNGDSSLKKMFSVLNQRDIVKKSFEVQKTLSITGAIVAAISLIVGGIGMMNVMLTTVFERTREIGIRRAVGARRKDILFQFLVESCLLSGVSAVLGILLGAMLTFGLPLIISVPAQPQILPTFLLLAVASGLFLGVVFGLFPAIKASKLSPGEALRAE